MIASFCSPHEDGMQARAACDSTLLAIVLTAENASCRALRGLRLSKDTIHTKLHGPKACGLALGYTLSPTNVGYACTEATQLDRPV